MANLASYLTDNSLSQAAFARLVGVDRATISRLAKAKPQHLPSLPLALAIERATNGDVPVAVWSEFKAGAGHAPSHGHAPVKRKGPTA